MKIIKYIIILYFLVVVTSLNGQNKITLKQCRDMAIERSEDWKIAGKQFEKAKTEKAIIKTMRLPNFSASATGLYTNKNIEMEMYLPTKKPNMLTGELEPDIMINPATGLPIMGADGNPVFNSYAWLPLNISLSGAYMASFTVEQPIYTGGKINAGNNMAEIGIQMAEINMELQQMNILVEVDKAYWTHVAVNEKVKLAKKAKSMLAAIVKIVDDSYQVGMVNKNELLKVQVKYNNAVIDLQRAKNGFQLSHLNLCRLTGLDYAIDNIVLDTIIPVDLGVALSLNPEDINQRPEYGLMAKSVDLKNENIKMARADFLPTAGLSAGYNHVAGIEFGDADYSNTNLNIIASVKIPVFHWGEGRNKMASAKIDKEIEQFKLEKNKKLLELDIQRTKLNREVAFESIRITTDALMQSDENLKVSNDNYVVGMGNLTDLLIAQTEWQKAYNNLIDSKTDYKIKETEYLRATGNLNNK